MTLPTEIITDHIHAPTTLSLDHHYHGLCLGWLALSLSLSLFLLPATAQLRHAPPPPPPDAFSKLKFDKNTAIIMVILVVVFFLLGFLSIYTRQCAERRLRGRMELNLPMGLGLSGRRPRGLEPEIIDSFPTLVYSTVKGRSTLECAVCLNEFEDDETLRLIPKCNHVFHPDCIDMWLGSHSTCPLCRANLVASSVGIQIPDHTEVGLDSQESPETPNLMSRSQRSRRLFSRSHSTGQNWERFTLRLAEEATIERTNSFTRERSQRQGYRTRSVGVSGTSHLRFTMNLNPPFFRNNPPPQLGLALGLGLGPSGPSIDDVSDRSTDPLCPQHIH